MADAEASSETVKLIVDLRDALTAQAAKIAELEVDRNEALNAAVESSEIAGEVCIKAHDATARAETLEAALREATPKFIDADLGEDCEYERCRDAYSNCSGELDRIKELIDDVLSPAPAADIQLPKGWLADEFARVDADVAQWSSGMKDSFKEATGIAIPPAPAPSEGGDGWQDIASAPRDGTPIQIWQEGLEPNQYVAAFDDRWSNGGWWVICDGKNTEIPLRGPAPTHWRNVFAAPTAPETT
jgi:hypothetical protein